MRIFFGTFCIFLGLILAIIMSPVPLVSWSFAFIMSFPLAGAGLIFSTIPRSGWRSSAHEMIEVQNYMNLDQIRYYEQMEYLGRGQATPKD
jgi:hypothetical protein